MGSDMILALLPLFPAQPPPVPDPACIGLSAAVPAALPWCVGKDLVTAIPGQIAANVVRSGIDAVADSFTRSVQPFLTMIFTYWEKVPSADLSSPSGPVALMQGSLHWFSQAVAVAALGIGAAKLVLSRRPEHAVGLGRSIATLFFATVVAVPLFNLLLVAGDEFSSYILNKATGGPFATSFVAFLALAPLSALGSLTMILVSLAAVIGGFIQLLFMFIRNAALLVVIGTYPLAAAAGRSWFQKQTGWIIAFVAFKPVASIVYATAFLAIRDDKSTMNVVLGVVLIVVAALALPALMRIAAPVTAAVAGGGGNGMVGLIGLAGAAATGARAWKGRSSGGGSETAGPRPATPTGNNRAHGPSGNNGPPGPRGGNSPGPPAAAGAPARGGGGPGWASAAGPAATGGGGTAAAASTAGSGAAAGGAAAGGAAAGGTAAAAAGGPVGAAAAAAVKVAGQAAKTVRRGAEDATGAGGTQ